MTRQQYLSWFDEVTGPTVSIMGLVPPDKLGWRLAENSFSLGQLMDHMGKALLFNAKVLAREELPAKSVREILVLNRRTPEATVEQAVTQFENGKRRIHEVINAMGEETFQSGEIDSPQRGRTEVWRFAAFVLEHHIHHLMELHVGLKLLGVNVNTKTLYPS